MAPNKQRHAWARTRSESKQKAMKAMKRCVMKKKKILRSGQTRRSNQAGAGKPDLRAISLVCPELAVAILAKQKDVENRTWPLPSTVCVPGGTWLALHVGSNRMPAAIRKHLQKAWDPAAACYPWKKMDLFQKTTGAPLPRSAIVGLIRIKGVRKLKRGERGENPWALGPMCWDIDRAVPLDKPIENVSGQVFCWSVDREQSISKRDRSRLYRALRDAKSLRGRGCFRPRR
eukprot:gb/GFBE01051295.1/.p1 GENE.gb/GFBE01051295.1/~~gb/GFBE01051295.1/.p1  ORF type:complete len:231 (+),score=27.99 gb/GFBE01051295.1/:1-693(+)